MNIDRYCLCYFSGFKEFFFENVSTKDRVIAGLKVLSLATVIIPFCVGAAYALSIGIEHLRGKVRATVPDAKVSERTERVREETLLPFSDEESPTTVSRSSSFKRPSIQPMEKYAELTEEQFKSYIQENGKWGGPEEVNVLGNLDLQFCKKLTSLPPCLHVEGSLNLYLTDISSLPAGLRVYGNLDLSRTNITSLPEGIRVCLNLDLSNSNIASLPSDIYVGGDLDLSLSNNIASLPEDLHLHVGGNLNLSNCKGLTSLPSSITQLGPKSSGEIRVINLLGTNLSDELIQRLRESDHPGIKFYFPPQT